MKQKDVAVLVGKYTTLPIRGTCFYAPENPSCLFKKKRKEEALVAVNCQWRCQNLCSACQSGQCFCLANGQRRETRGQRNFLSKFDGGQKSSAQTRRGTKQTEYRMSSILETVRNVLAGAGSAPVSDSDALALAVHASLEHDGLRCIATDESQASSGPATAPARTNPLPASWNKSQDVYSFFYRHESSPALVVVKGVVMDDTMLVHAASDRVDDVHTLELRQVVV
jgi:hypothetical protein